MNYRFEMRVAAFLVCVAVTAACESAMNSPVSPTAAAGGASALNADGSNLKVDAPLALSPLFEQTNTSTAPNLAARGSRLLYERGVTFSHRFQVADADSFAYLVATGMGVSDASGVTRWTVDPVLAAGRRYVWRVRAELGDAFGPWSNVMAFTTAAPETPAPTTPTTPTAGGNLPRTADPAPGSRLPLPDLRSILARFADARESCPRGLKYVNNPWQDRVIDAFRATDSRWGYNGKPTRQAVHNGGFPVIAAGDEAAYHYGSGPDQGSPNVHLVDLLSDHCGSNPTLAWRVFTGEEPGFWTGAGRF
jgi:hypothetical protein